MLLYLFVLADHDYKRRWRADDEPSQIRHDRGHVYADAPERGICVVQPEEALQQLDDLCKDYCMARFSNLLSKCCHCVWTCCALHVHFTTLTSHKSEGLALCLKKDAAWSWLNTDTKLNKMVPGSLVLLAHPGKGSWGTFFWSQGAGETQIIFHLLSLIHVNTSHGDFFCSQLAAFNCVLNQTKESIDFSANPSSVFWYSSEEQIQHYPFKYWLPKIFCVSLITPVWTCRA